MFNQAPGRTHPIGFSINEYGQPDSQPYQRPQATLLDSQVPLTDATAFTHGRDRSRNSDSVSNMDWISTDAGGNPQYHHDGFSDGMPGSSDAMDFEDLSPPQNNGGVGRLVAHFENKGFSPPLPPRPVNNGQPSSLGTNSSLSTHFGSLNAAAHIQRAPSPVASPIDSHFGSFGSFNRMASPFDTSTMDASSSLISFDGFPDMGRMHNSSINNSTPFGSLDDFLPDNNVNRPMGTNHLTQFGQPSMQNTVAGGTPGFEIWRPPAAMTIKTERPDRLSPPSSIRSSKKPPVPTTPKPIMNTGSQFILEYHPTANSKGKAPVKPPRPRMAPPPPPPRPRIDTSASTSTGFLEIKQEPTTPGLSEVSSPFSALSDIQHVASTSLRSQAGTRPSREQVPAEAWEQYKSTIRSLYLEERKPLKEVMAVMAEKHGFQATPKMYKTRFSQWGFVKNNTEDEVKRLLSMKFQRDAEGKVSEFVRNGKVVNIGTYLKRKGVTEYDLVDFELSADLPAYIRCRTPTPPLAPGYLRSPDLVRAQELVVGSIRKAFLQCRQHEVETNAQVGWPTIQVWGTGSSDMLLEANFYFEAGDTDSGGQLLMNAFNQLEEDLKLLSPQGINEILLGMVNRDLGVITALCKYLAAYSSTNLDRSHPLRQIFGCLYEVQQKHGSGTLSELLWGTIPIVAEELEAIYGRRHPYVARAWADLALFYDHVNTDRLELLVQELRAVQRQEEQRQGLQNADVVTIRYVTMQLLYAAGPQSEATKQAALELWTLLRSMNVMFPMRDTKQNAYCYHSPVKVDPWSKRCRRRYDSGVAIFEEHIHVKIHPYFEEDFHTAHHVPEPQDSWATAMEQQMQLNRWHYI